MSTIIISFPPAATRSLKERLVRNFFSSAHLIWLRPSDIVGSFLLSTGSFLPLAATGLVEAQLTVSGGGVAVISTSEAAVVVKSRA